MRCEVNNYRRTVIVLILAVAAAAIYLLSIKLAYPVFQNTRLTDPLAEINSLFPLYYVALFLLAISAILTFVFKITNRGVHILILLLFSIMLWYTRYYLAGFTWEPDSARNLGVSLHINDILNGAVFQYSDYGAQFPLPYVLEYVIYIVSGMNTSVYFHLIPLIWIIVFALLSYTFINSIFSSQKAFLASLLAFAGMHYIIFITGAHTIGVLLLLTTISILLRRGISWRLLTLGLILVVVLCHPISPILLAVFLGATFLAYLSRSNIKSQLVIGGMLLICFGGWAIWPELSTIESSGIIPPISDMFPSDFPTSRLYIFGSPFIYTSIYTLNKLVYVLYGLIVVAAMITVFWYTQRKNRNWKVSLKQLGGLSRNQWFLIICIPLFLIAAVLLAENSHDLIERGLTMAILTISGVIASVVVDFYEGVSLKIKRLTTGLVTVVFLLLVFTFPVITYSLDAYSSFPKSEEQGLKFLNENISFADKILVASFRQQMILYQTEFEGMKNALYTTSVDEVTYSSCVLRVIIMLPCVSICRLPTIAGRSS